MKTIKDGIMNSIINKAGKNNANNDTFINGYTGIENSSSGSIGNESSFGKSRPLGSYNVGQDVQSIHTTRNSARKLFDDIREKEEAINKLNSQKEFLLNGIEELKNKISTQESDIDKVTHENNELKGVVGKQLSAIKKISLSFTALTGVDSGEKDAIDKGFVELMQTLTDSVKKLKDIIESKDNLILTAEEKLKSAQKELLRAENDRQMVDKSLESAQRELLSLRTQLSKAEGEIKEYHEAVQGLEGIPVETDSVLSRSKAVNHVDDLPEDLFKW